MYSININEIIEAVKFSGLLSLNKGDEKDLYDRLSTYEDLLLNDR